MLEFPNFAQYNVHDKLSHEYNISLQYYHSKA